MDNQPYWLVYIEELLDRVGMGHLSREQADELIRKNKELPDEVRKQYGWKPRGRPPKDNNNGPM